MLTGSDSAPAKANEASQKNAIGTARDDVYLTVQNAQMEAYQTAYVENGVSAGEASTTVGNYVRTKLNEKYGTDGNFKTGLATITATENGNIEISTTDFVIEGEIADKGGNLTWGEIEPNIPRISGMPETLSLDTSSNYTINAKLKGKTGNIIWSSNKPSIASVSNGVITTALSITNPTEQVIITASADGCESKTCILTVNKIMTAKDVIPVPTSSTTSAYVKYAMNGQTTENAEMCRVLYNDDEHGLQIITTDSVTTVTLGKNDNIGAEGTNGTLSKAQNSYNNAIENLNNKAQSYIKTGDNIVSDARCIGSLPMVSSEIFNKKNKAIDNEGQDVEKYSEFTDEDKIQYNSIYWNTDVNYIEDETKLKDIGEYKSGYWLASRIINIDSNYIRFGIRYTDIEKTTRYFTMWKIQKSTGIANPVGTEMGFRPVFLIKNTAKIKSGTGASDDPYILEAGN